MDRWQVLCAVLVALGVTGEMHATTVTIASYEPEETDLTVAASDGDAGLSVTRVLGGVAGAPAATDGAYVLRVDIDGEADGKVEFRHFWTLPAYSLAGFDMLLADLYVTDAAVDPGTIGIFDVNWLPPNAWQPATGDPQVGAWTTVTVEVADREQVDLTQIWAFVLEDLPGTTGTVYVDYLRLVGTELTLPPPENVAALGREFENEVAWRPLANASGYHVERAPTADSPFERLTAAPITNPHFVDRVSRDRGRFFYRVVAVAGDVASPPSAAVPVAWNNWTDEQMLDIVQQTTFRYFWDLAHPVSGLALEGIGFGHPPDTVTTGGTGMGLMTIVVGAERGFVTRAEAAARVRKMLAFLQDVTPRFHGAWAHHYHGATGAVIPFAGLKDNGADLVETAFLVQGILVARQYFDDPDDPVEAEIRARAIELWEGVEWSHFRRFPDSDVLYWHWSPDYGWDLNLQIRGYNEAQMVYLLAIASPTHPMPAHSYHAGWAGLGSYTNGGTFYGQPLEVGPAFGGPLFFTHYSNLGFDPRYRRDAYANYFANGRAIAEIHRRHSSVNPNGFDGFSRFAWGLTASADPGGYAVHDPLNDNGTLTPTAALSSMPYLPAAAQDALRYYFDRFGASLWTVNGFYDALNPTTGWVGAGYLAIDQGPIVPMIENHRTGLCWELFMSNPEIGPMLAAVGLLWEIDFDRDGAVDADDWLTFAPCLGGVDELPPCSELIARPSDLDLDADVDLADVAVAQRLAGRALIPR